MYDIGNWIGGVFTGRVSDKVGRKAIFMVPMLFISLICMLIVRLFLNTAPLPYYFVIFGIGVFLGGPYNIISAAVSIDLA